MPMTQEEAQELAVKTWGKDAIAEVRGGSCFVSRSKYGLCTPYAHGGTFEEAFYESQFGYTNCASYEASSERPQFHCNNGGDRINWAKWPENWNKFAAIAVQS